MKFNRLYTLLAGAALLASACAVVPKTDVATAPPPTPAPEPSVFALLGIGWTRVAQTRRSERQG